MNWLLKRRLLLIGISGGLALILSLLLLAMAGLRAGVLSHNIFANYAGTGSAGAA